MPQIEQLAGTYASQFFWLLLTFGILYFGIARAMLPKVGRVVHDREAKIAGDIAGAQEAQGRASHAQAAWDEALAKARGEAQAIAAQASAEASRENASRLAALDNDLEAKATDADARLAKAREAAFAQLDGIAAEAAGEIVARLTGTAPSPEAAVQAVTAARGA